MKQIGLNELMWTKWIERTIRDQNGLNWAEVDQNELKQTYRPMWTKIDSMDQSRPNWTKVN